jgi:hypothetical protein
MTTSIHIEATVSPDGKIEISVPQLQPGQRVHVSIQPEQAPALSTDEIHIIDLIKDQPGHRLFKSAEEVDEYLRQERDSWDR